MARYQVIDAENRKTNIIEWDGVTPLDIPGHTIEPEDGTPIWTPVPASVSPLQARKALRILGLMPMVKAFLANADEEIVEAWEFATAIDRDNGFIAFVGGELGMNSYQIDDLFRIAATL